MLALFKPMLMLFVVCMYGLFYIAHQTRIRSIFGGSLREISNDMHHEMPYFGIVLTAILGVVGVFGGVPLSLWVLVLFSSWGVLAPDTYTESNLDPKRRLLPLLVVILSGYWVATLHIPS